MQTPVTCLPSGPLGGDQQNGALIAEGKLDRCIFCGGPPAQPRHEPDSNALLRISVVWNLPPPCDRAAADYLISSPLPPWDGYQRRTPDVVSPIAYVRVEAAEQLLPLSVNKTEQL